MDHSQKKWNRFRFLDGHIIWSFDHGHWLLPFANGFSSEIKIDFVNLNYHKEVSFFFGEKSPTENGFHFWMYVVDWWLLIHVLKFFRVVICV